MQFSMNQITRSYAKQCLQMVPMFLECTNQHWENTYTVLAAGWMQMYIQNCKQYHLLYLEALVKASLSSSSANCKLFQFLNWILTAYYFVFQHKLLLTDFTRSLESACKTEQQPPRTLPHTYTQTQPHRHKHTHLTTYLWSAVYSTNIYTSQGRALVSPLLQRVAHALTRWIPPPPMSTSILMMNLERLLPTRSQLCQPHGWQGLHGGWWSYWGRSRHGFLPRSLVPAGQQPARRAGWQITKGDQHFVLSH